LVAGITVGQGFLPMQQRVGLRHIRHIGRCTNQCMDQPGVCIHTDVRLHAKEPLVALLGLVHLGVALTRLVLG